jgi:hypothetical protein
MVATPRKALPPALVIVALLAGGLLLSSVVNAKGKSAAADAKTEGLAAWRKVYSVLISPRCINCHTAADHPQQGDDRHRHSDGVARGPEGRGVPGLECTTCHGESNDPDTGVPGARDWHLAPLSMRWQDESDRPLSSAAVCSGVTDRSRNHDLDGPGLQKHFEVEPLALWGWDPGRRPDGTHRALPPLPRPEFIEAVRRWVAAGTPCPKE